MKKFLTLIILIYTVNYLSAQKNSKTDSVSNQRGLEKTWTVQLFREKYFLQPHTQYSGLIIQTDKYYFHFGQKVFRTLDSDSVLYTLCKLGILYPDIIPGGMASTDTTTLTYLVEIKYLNTGPTVRRFHFNLNMTRLSNPIVDFIELTNKNATESTSLFDFIKDASLTFIVQGWIMM
ncbi:MAG TPA: hypothetical protein VK772_03955 [Puia sp.]|nr:hypothetical protein [Puia sp.]